MTDQTPPKYDSEHTDCCFALFFDPGWPDSDICSSCKEHASPALLDEDQAPTPEARQAAEPKEAHFLKTWPQFFAALIDGTKTFEARKDDRNFKVGDLLVLQEFDPTPETGGFTGREIDRTISYILRGTEHVASGYCILGLLDATRAADAELRRELEEAKQEAQARLTQTLENARIAESAIREWKVEVDSLRTALRDATEWRPIDTAPKDGTRILISLSGKDLAIGHWSVENDDWENDDFDAAPFNLKPTHWLPLPSTQHLDQP